VGACEVLSQSGFASLVGCSQQNISKMISKGILIYENKKLHIEKNLERLRDFGLLDENNKLKKSRTKKEEPKDPVAELPLFVQEVGYKTRKDMTDEEIKRELEEKKAEAEEKNIDIEEDVTSDIEDISTYAEAKAYREAYMAKIAELDYKIKKGEFLAKDDVEKYEFERARIVRNGFLALPHKVSVIIANKTDVKEIESIIEAEVMSILENLS
jgi:hypothetical protein